jgi:hypothetical protein
MPVAGRAVRKAGAETCGDTAKERTVPKVHDIVDAEFSAPTSVATSRPEGIGRPATTPPDPVS